MILARVTVVANRKGGTAKTTTVVNLAHEIARCNKRVLVIDCDNQGQVEEGFKAMCKDAELTSPGWLQNQSFFKGLAKVSEYLHICQPNQEKFIAPDDLTWLGALVNHASVQQDYDYVVIDTPPTLGTVLLGAMSVADTIVVPAEPTPLASSGVIKLVNTCMQAVRKRQLKAQQILLLPVMVDKQLYNTGRRDSDNVAFCLLSEETLPWRKHLPASNLCSYMRPIQTVPETISSYVQILCNTYEEKLWPLFT